MFRGMIGLSEKLLRNRDEIFSQIGESADVKGVVRETTRLFLVLSALYGLCMGSYRWVHPQFFFSDFVIGQEAGAVEGRVSWVDYRQGLVYTETDLPTDTSLASKQIRFNVSDPTAPYRIEAVSHRGPYRQIRISGGAFAQSHAWKYGLTSMVKVPLLFLGTLLVCLPALYVVNIIFGLNMHFKPTVALFACALAAISLVLAAFVPIVLFFSLFTSDYHFMKLLNVAAILFASLYGLNYLYHGQLALNPSNLSKARTLLTVWLGIYAFVGTQVAWLLRPFIGTPYLPEFAALRPLESNFYVSLFGSFGQLFR
ncbi:MAG: hypothetical protein HY318_20930 [Armatimonadetes bacterium]|nr:hypothetical protein [Armatimonadota bacterium]